MEILEQMINSRGRVLPGNVLKVDSFLNHQIDVKLATEMGKDIYEHFKHCGVNKILTIEASGIGLACLTAQFFNCNVVYAKKTRTSNLSDSVYTSKAFSYTHQVDNTILVSKDYISKDDKVLILDDFLAHGEASRALMDIVEQAGGQVVGMAIAIEKGFQGAGDKLRQEGIDVYSLAIVESMEEGKVVFRK